MVHILGDGDIGRNNPKSKIAAFQCPMLNAQCPMPEI